MTETLNDLLPEFIKELQEKSRSPSTILAYKADLAQLIDLLRKKDIVSLEQITKEDIEYFRDTLLAQKYTPKSASRKLNAVKTFFRWLMKNNKLQVDPSKDVSHPKINPSLPKFLSAMEYRALRDVVKDDPRIYAIIELILQAGLRISEVANLKADSLQEEKVIVDAYATQPKRYVPLNASAKEAIESYKKIRPQSDSLYLFVSKNGKPLAVRNIRAAIDRYMRKAEIPAYSVNDLRTTFIVENLKGGVDLITISQIAGHKRLSTTERYLVLAKVDNPGKKQDLVEL